MKDEKLREKIREVLRKYFVPEVKLHNIIEEIEVILPVPLDEAVFYDWMIKEGYDIYKDGHKKFSQAVSTRFARPSVDWPKELTYAYSKKAYPDNCVEVANKMRLACISAYTAASVERELDNNKNKGE